MLLSKIPTILDILKQGQDFFNSRFSQVKAILDVLDRPISREMFVHAESDSIVRIYYFILFLVLLLTTVAHQYSPFLEAPKIPFALVFTV